MFNRWKGRQDTSEILKAKQHGAAALLFLAVAAVMLFVRLRWGSMTIGSGQDAVTLGECIYYVNNIVLIFGAIDLVSAICSLLRWNKKGRPYQEDDGLLADWKNGERSPVKVALALLACVAVLVLLLIVRE
ncbi:MAG: hypothetical protein HFG22_12110 [Lachnospiraceae bacterium]|nr:hypothetical protein [Lachnospiraceae bacterium]